MILEKMLIYLIKFKPGIGNHYDMKIKRSKINLFTPCRVLGSKLILAAPSSPAKSDPVLRSPWGRGKRRKSMNLGS